MHVSEAGSCSLWISQTHVCESYGNGEHWQRNMIRNWRPPWVSDLNQNLGQKKRQEQRWPQGLQQWQECPLGLWSELWCFLCNRDWNISRLRHRPWLRFWLWILFLSLCLTLTQAGTQGYACTQAWIHILAWTWTQAWSISLDFSHWRGLWSGSLLLSQ